MGENEVLESPFPKPQICLESVEPLSINRDPKLTQKCIRLCHLLPTASSDDAISGGNVKSIDRYAVLNFEAARFSSFRENQIEPFA